MRNRFQWIIFGLVAVVGVVAGAALVIGALTLRNTAASPTEVAVAETVAIAPSATDAATATPLPPSPTPPLQLPAATESASPTESAAPTATTGATPAPFITYTIASDETLTGIALGYNVTVEDIVAANNLSNPDLIRAGQTLLIPLFPADVGSVAAAAPPPAPAGDGSLATPTLLPTESIPGTGEAGATRPPVPADWPPSLISGDLARNYPSVQATGSGALLIHYQPGTAPAQQMGTLAPLIEQIFATLQGEMGGSVGRQVDVYLGGTLFAINPALQGYTQSYEFRTFVLVNGAFHPGERNYILGHELAHVAATHILGPASSTMIHEGLAAYLPQEHLVQEAGYLPIQEICAAAYQTNVFRSAGELVQLAYGANAFGGHIRTFFNYNLSGCFVGYLLENWGGMERLDEVYDSGNYQGVYGLSFRELDEAWQASLANISLSVDAEEFVAVVEDVATAYESYINASAGGDHAHYEAYLHLNRARLAANRGRLDEARAELETFWALSGL